MLTEFKLKMLNREANSKKNKPSEVIEHLNIHKGMVLGDIGSGGGYYTGKFSKKVGDNGRVYAIDVNQESLDFIADNLNLKGINNVKTIKANSDKIDLPSGSVDIFFLRNVFHHLPQQRDYFKNLKKLLKDNGKIAIIDYNKRKFSFAGLFGHYTSKEDLLDIMDAAGFYPHEQHDFLPDQLFITFTRKSE